MEPPVTPRGFAVFVTVWFGQVVSFLGSGLTGFAVGVWVYQKTGSATLYGLISLCAILPGVVLSPLVGALVDRWDRRHVMILSDSGAALCTAVLAGLIWTGRLEIWHIYLIEGLSSSFGAFQYPAFSAATTLLVPKRHLGRASGMVQLGFGLTQTLAPVLAGVLVGQVGIRGVVLVDGATFLFSLVTLLLVRFPRPEVSEEGRAARGSLKHEALYGWRYIRQRPGLLALLLLIASTNFFMGFLQVLVAPLVLSFASAEVLGIVLSVSGFGMLGGSLLMGLGGGPRKRVRAILLATLVQGLLLFLGGLRPSATLVAVAAFVFLFAQPIIDSSGLVVWQSKVPPDLQGRVFAVRRMAVLFMMCLSYVVAGPLADRVFEPLLMPGGALADTVGQVIGVGHGRGIGLLFIVLGALVLMLLAIAARYPRLLRVETELPDAIGE